MTAEHDPGLRARLRQGATVTVLVYALLTLAALPVTVLATGSLSDATTGQPRGLDALSESGGAVLVEALERTFVDGAPWLALAAGAGALLLVLLSPWLSVAWATALHRPLRTRDALRAGGRLYLRSLGLSVIAGLVLLLLLSLASLAFLLYFPLSTLDDERLRDAGLLLSALPALGVTCLWASATDLCRAALAAGAPGLGAALRVGLSRLRPRVVGVYVLFAMCGGALTLLGTWGGASIDGPGLLPAALTLAVGQTIALARVGLRGAWLATAVGAVEPACEAARMAWQRRQAVAGPLPVADAGPEPEPEQEQAQGPGQGLGRPPM